MNVVGRVGNLISRGVYSVATPFHPFGGAVDVIVVQQPDGTFRTTPWYVRFGKFQGVFKGAVKAVSIKVNGVEADFNMYLDKSGEAYFYSEVGQIIEKDRGVNNADDVFDESSSVDITSNAPVYRHRLQHSISSSIAELQDSDTSDLNIIERAESDAAWRYYEFQDDHQPQPSLEKATVLSEYGSCRYENLDIENLGEPESEVVLFSVDGHVLTAHVLDSEQNTENVPLSTPRFHLGPGEGSKFFEDGAEIALDSNTQSGLESSAVNDICGVKNDDSCDQKVEVCEVEGENSCENLEVENCTNPEYCDVNNDIEDSPASPEKEAGSSPSSRVPRDAGVETTEEFSHNEEHTDHDSVSANDPPLAAVDGVHGRHGSEVEYSGSDHNDKIAIEHDETVTTEGIESDIASTSWLPSPITDVNTIERTSSSSSEEIFVDSESDIKYVLGQPSEFYAESPRKQFIRTNVPSSDQIASLNLKDGQNFVTFTFSTRVMGVQEVEAHIYLWKWNARIVISDVDGTITKSDVLGQFMPLVGKDWTQSGVAKLFSAIKENGYQLLFLSARAIVQACITRSFLLNLKQDGDALPSGPVVISPDGLFPSLFREVVRRAPHEFKIACLEDIKKLFPAEYNPFYAGFGNRDTDELSYRKVGIPKGKIFIINPKGEVAISHCIVDVRTYTSLHTLVDDMFPPVSLVEEEDYNSWNFWKVPPQEMD